LNAAAGSVRLVIIRHGPAADRETFARDGQNDAERPLTERGREKMVANARGLRTLVPSLDVLATSPLTRAAETAEIVAREYDSMPVARVSVLAPGGRRDDFLEWLRTGGRAEATIAVVGHEPDLGELVAWLVTGEPTPFFSFKKGGAALVELVAPATPGRGTLRWLLSPAVLRSLAR
jgi:phosphohistidine phosphatase